MFLCWLLYIFAIGFQSLPVLLYIFFRCFPFLFSLLSVAFKSFFVLYSPPCQLSGRLGRWVLCCSGDYVKSLIHGCGCFRVIWLLAGHCPQPFLWLSDVHTKGHAFKQKHSSSLSCNCKNSIKIFFFKSLSIPVTFYPTLFMECFITVNCGKTCIV